jgi:hypothetical protein
MHTCIYVLFSTDFLVADYDDKPDYKCCTPWGSTQIFYHGTPYVQIATKERTSEGDFIYVHRKKLDLLGADAHEFVPISRTQFYPARTKSVEYMANLHLR